MTESSERTDRAADLLKLAVCCGLIAGVAQLAALAARKLVEGGFLYVPVVILALAPLVTAAVFVLIAFGIVCLRPISRGLFGTPLALGAFAALGVLGTLYPFGQIHRVALLVLAGGVGVQVGRMASTRRPGVRRFVDRTLPWLGGAYAIALAIVFGAGLMRERNAAQALGEPDPSAPNVLLIILDTVRAANTSTYGYERETTPNLTRIAEGGVRFEHAFSTSPWTLPAHGSLFTGRYPHDLEADWEVPLGDTYPTIAEILGEAGYHTCAASANHDYATAEVGLARGFVRFDDHSLALGEVLKGTPLTLAVTRSRFLRRLLLGEDIFGRRRAPAITDGALECFDEAGDRPAFVFLNYYEAHRPYRPPPPFRGRFVPEGEGLDPRIVRNATPGDHELVEKTVWAVNAYDGAIAYLDDRIGALMDSLEARGHLDDTLVLITSDHGEEFGEHRVFDHGNTLYRQALEVPLVVTWPGRVPSGEVVAPPVSLVSIPATILDLVGQPAAPSFEGTSLAPLWRDPGDSAAPIDPVLSEVRRVVRQPEWYPASAGNLTSLVFEGSHYILNLDTGTEELFDLAGDPEETEDLSATEPGRAVIGRARPMAEALSRGR
ncbi:MAG: sulfatase [Gemmatimonadota bacterium]|nr:sulfatase [Gemmatimonadota bacterium]